MHAGVFKEPETANVIIDLRNIAELQTVKVNDINFKFWITNTSKNLEFVSCLLVSRYMRAICRSGLLYPSLV